MIYFLIYNFRTFCVIVANQKRYKKKSIKCAISPVRNITSYFLMILCLLTGLY